LVPNSALVIADVDDVSATATIVGSDATVKVGDAVRRAL
jgi:hypothetical protein